MRVYEVPPPELPFFCGECGRSATDCTLFLAGCPLNGRDDYCHRTFASCFDCGGMKKAQARARAHDRSEHPRSTERGG